MISFAKAIATVHNLFSDTINAFQDMETYAARLASFDKAPSTGTKKRASNAKGVKVLKWPHKTPSPAQVGLSAYKLRIDADPLVSLRQPGFSSSPPLHVQIMRRVSYAKEALMDGKRMTIPSRNILEIHQNAGGPSM